MTVTVKYIDVDTTDAEAALDQLKEHTNLVSTTTLSLVRKSYTSLALLGDIMGIAIPQWFNLMFASAMMAAQTYREMATAELVGSGGALAWKAFLSYSASVIMFSQAMAILLMGTEADQKLNSILQLMNVWS
jgi:hypothetical protein